MSQLIITLSREFGSGGHEIAEILAKKFDIPLYDDNILKEIALEKDIDHEELERYDEAPRITLFSKTRRGYSSSPQENIAHMQFEYLRAKAEKGESFVVVGRCSETILKGYPGMVSIFVLGDKACKLERIKKIDRLSTVAADVLLTTQDKKRKAYHNYYCPIKWGDSRNYDICINSSPLGVEGTADILEKYIKTRIEKN